jgi:hypothetical protein
MTREAIYSDMQCPKCSTLMQLMRKYEALIDYCPSCKGVWLDRGEIDKIAQIQSSYEDEHYNKYHYNDEGYDDKYNDNRWRRRGFFGDLFNF